MGPTCGKEVRRYLKATGGPVAKTNCSQGSLSQPKPLELSRAQAREHISQPPWKLPVGLQF